MDMTKTKMVEIKYEICDKCGDELFEYDERGNPPHHLYGVYWGEDDKVYCERTCIPED